MAYKFQLGAAKLGGAVESTGQVKGTSLDAMEGNVSNVGALTADSIGKDDGASELGLADDMRAATNKQIQFRSADQKIFSPSVDQMAIEASASIQFDVDATGTLRMTPAEVEIKAARLSMSGSGKFRYGENMQGGKLLVADGNDFASVAMSGDAALAAGGALTIANNAINNAKMADDSVGAAELIDDSVGAAAMADDAVGTAVIVDNAVTLAKMAGITRGSLILGDSSGDPSLLAKGTAAQLLQSDGTDPSYVSISGDATVAAGGALTIANNAITQAKMADDAIGADELAANAVVNASVAANAAIALSKINTNVDMGGAFTIGNQANDVATFTGGVIVGGDLTVNGTTTTVNSTTVQIDDLNLQLADGAAAAGSVDGGGITLATSGDDFTFAYNHATTAWKSSIDMDLANNKLFKINGTEVLSAVGAKKVQSDVAGAGLAHSGGALSVGVDGTGIEINSDALRLKDGGVTADKMANLAATNLYVGSAGNRPVAVALSGDVTMNNAGLVTISATAVEAGMLNSNVISGQTELASGLADTDELMVSDGGVLKRMDVSVLKSHILNPSAPNGIADANGNLAIGINFPSADASAARTWTLPDSANVVPGDSVIVKAYGNSGTSGRALTIARGTASGGNQEIDGSTSDAVVLESDSAAITFYYVATDKWIIV